MHIERYLATALALVLFAGLPAPPVSAVGGQNAEKLLPAHFGSGKRAFYEIVEYPESVRRSPGVNAIVYCQVILSRKGRVESQTCFSPTKPAPPQAFAESVYEALGRARFEPASANGKPVAVSMNLQVIFNCDDNDCTPVALPNFGRHADKLGPAYMSPQEIIEKRNWYERLLMSDICAGDDGRIAEACVSERMANYTVMVEVDEKGKTGLAKTLRGKDSALPAFVAAAEKEISESRFIPAIHDGSFIALPAVHVALYHDKGIRKSMLPRTICEEKKNLGSRLAKETCYTPLEYELKRRKNSLSVNDWYSGNTTVQ